MRKDTREDNPSFEELARDLEPAAFLLAGILSICGAQYLLEQMFGGPAWLMWASATLLVLAAVISYFLYALDEILRQCYMLDDEE